MTTVLYLRVITSVILACFQLNRKKIKHLFICTLNRVICVNTIMEHFVRVIKYVLGIMKSFNCCIIVNKPIKQRVPPQPDVGTYSCEPGWTRNCIREKVSYSSRDYIEPLKTSDPTLRWFLSLKWTFILFLNHWQNVLKPLSLWESCRPIDAMMEICRNLSFISWARVRVSMGGSQPHPRANDEDAKSETF